MQNRFGVKDFVLMLLVIVIIVLQVIRIYQDDRNWKLVEQVRQEGTQRDKAISRLERKLDEGNFAVAAPGNTTGGTAAGGRDESWARPGVPIEWQPAWTFFTDPREEKDYEEGGTITEVFPAQPAKITAILAGDVYGVRVGDFVLESLGAYDANTLKMRGCLAEAWQIDPNGLWVRARIRANARFSDGTPVTAEDFRYTVKDFIMNPLIEADRSRSLMDSVDDVIVVNEKTVEFTFKTKYYANTELALGMSPLPKAFYSQLQPSQINSSTGLLVGSGPYKLERVTERDQWSPPAPVVLVRNEQYWGTRPPIDRVVFKTINDEMAAITDYKNGNSDINTPAPSQFVRLCEDPEWVKNNHCLNWINMRSGRGGIAWNCGPRGGMDGKLTPFHDKRVRVAMTLLLDRQKMIDDLSKGIGQIPNGYFNPGTPGFDPNLKPWPYDVAQGLALLKEAGWWDRDSDNVLENEAGEEFSFQLTYGGGGEATERQVKFIVDAYAAAGIRCVPNPMDWAVTDVVRNARNFDAMLIGWGASAPEGDPKQIFHSGSILNQGDNFGQWNSPDADAAIDAARAEMDGDKRAVLWKKFNQVMHDEQPYTWTRMSPTLRFVKPKFGNVHTYPKGIESWEFYQKAAEQPTPTF